MRVLSPKSAEQFCHAQGLFCGSSIYLVVREGDGREGESAQVEMLTSDAGSPRYWKSVASPNQHDGDVLS
ncbi:MAG: hypothetical protein ACQ9IQ_00665 [Nitrospirales bacterium]